MKKLLSLFLISIFSIGILQSQNLPEPMYPHRLVNDFANIFTNEEKASLEQILRNYNDSTSTQIYVVSVADLDGYAASDYAVKLGEKWGVGQKGKDNGAVILIKPKRGNSRGDVFIAVGYGLEEKLNDARIGRILDTDMIPSLRNNDYYSGVRETIFSMIGYLSGQYQGDPNEEHDGIGLGEIIGIIVLVILLSSKKGRWILFALLSSMGNGGGGRSGGGRGFGGGGGGRFGGGGAGRSW